MKEIFILIFSLISLSVTAQTPYIVSGIDTTLKTYIGYAIWPQTSPLSVLVKNSRIVSGLAGTYMLIAGQDSYYVEYAHNLDNTIITGNVFDWTGYNTYPASSMHTIMAGYNINYHIKFNYFDEARHAVVYESTDSVPMAYTSGGHTYNLHYNIRDIIVAGVNGLKLYNNTFYNSRYDDGKNALIYVRKNANTDDVKKSPSRNIEIKNNIFFTKQDQPAIWLDNDCDIGFVCDYNVYWNEANGGNPKFDYKGTTYTWAQWRSLGYDAHSIVINPNFFDTLSLVPSQPIYYGADLGEKFAYGLATDAEWVVGEHPDTIRQGDVWQVGARIYDTKVLFPEYIRSFVENATPARLEMIYNVTLVNIVPAASAFTVMVNSSPRSVSLVVVSGAKVMLTLASPVVYGDVVTVSYSIPATYPLQTAGGGQAASLTTQSVINNCTLPTNLPPVISISSPRNNSSFQAPDIITLTAEVSDSDGEIIKVEYYNGPLIKIGESYTVPFPVSFECIRAGTYEITALATDNRNSVSTSSPVKIFVTLKNDTTNLINLYPNPNDGHFKIDILFPLSTEKYNVTIVNLIGETIYNGLLTQGDNKKEYDFSHIDSGIYILFIAADTTIVATKKFIKI